MENNKKKIGLFPLVADVLHPGHLLAIEEAKQHCDYLIVALHCCPNYKQPVQSIYERYMQLRAVKWVDEVIPYTDINDSAKMIASLNYDIYFLGEDHKGEHWENDELVHSLGKEIYYTKRRHNFSSTNIKQRINNKTNKEN